MVIFTAQASYHFLVVSPAARGVGYALGGQFWLGFGYHFILYNVSLWHGYG